MKHLTRLFIAAIIVLPATLFAASDGSIGTTSTGSTTISLTIPKLIVATQFTNINLGTYDGFTAPTGTDDICIGTNNSSGNFKVTATGSGASSAFTITDGSNTIAYSVGMYTETGRGSSATALSSGTQSATLTVGTRKTLAQCASAGASNLNASYGVDITNTNAQAAPDGSYSGTLTLVFAPQ